MSPVGTRGLTWALGGYAVSYKVLFHQGDSIDIQTKACSGRLSVEDGRILIVGESELSIPVGHLRSVELFRMHNTGRMLKVVHNQGTLFVTVIRFNLFGYFAMVNFFATGRLQKELQSLIGSHNSA